MEELRGALSTGWSKVVAKDYAEQLMASVDENKGPAPMPYCYPCMTMFRVPDGQISLEEWVAFFKRMWSDEVTEHIDDTMAYLLFGSEAVGVQSPGTA